MSRPQHIAISSLSVAAIVAIVVLVILGASGGAAAEAPCGPRTDGVYLATARTVATRIRDEELAGATVLRALRTISSDRALASAVAAGDLPAVHRELLAILFNHQHIVRLRVLRAGRVLDDVGGPLVLSPVSGRLRSHGRDVGTFAFSVQDDMGYRLLAARLVGARTVMRYGSETVMANIGVGSAALRDGGVVRVAGTAYLIGSLDIGRFPTGTLRVALLVPRPRAALSHVSCAQVRTDVLGGVARRVYDESLTGPAITSALGGVRHDRTLAAALARGDRATARHEVEKLFNKVHLVRLQVSSSGGVVADLGTRQPLVAPVTMAIVDGSGARVGAAAMAVQSVGGFVGVSSYLTQARVLARDEGHQLGGRIAGPATLPASGAVAYAGARYYVSSFSGTLFGGGAMTVYTLARDQG